MAPSVLSLLSSGGHKDLHHTTAKIPQRCVSNMMCFAHQRLHNESAEWMNASENELKCLREWSSNSKGLIINLMGWVIMGANYSVKWKREMWWEAKSVSCLLDLLGQTLLSTCRTSCFVMATRANTRTRPVLTCGVETFFCCTNHWCTSINSWAHS